MRSGSKCKIRRKQAIWLYLFGRELFQFFYSSFAWIQIPEFVIVVQLLSHVLLWDLMDCSMPVFPVLHYLLEFAQCMFIVLVMLSNHLILCYPLLFLPSIFPKLRVLSFPMNLLFASGKQSIGASATASVLPMNIQGWLPWGLVCLIFF